MNISLSLILFAFTMILQTEDAFGTENIILGTIGGDNGSRLGANSCQKSFKNINGIVTSYENRISYEQKPDGSCIVRTVEVKNGKKSENEEPIDCEVAKQIIKQYNEKTKKEIKKQQEDIKKQHEEMMKEHLQSTLNLQNQIDKMKKAFHS